MRVLMLGWEFPPFISGGLGTACFGLTRALVNQGLHITFILPRAVDDRHTEHLRILGPPTPGSSPAPGSFQGATGSDLGAAGSGRRTTTRAATGSFATIPVPAVRRSPYGGSFAGRIAARGTPPPEAAGVGGETSSRAGETSGGGVIGFLDGGPGEDPYASEDAPITDAQRYARMVVDRVAHESFDVIHAHDWMTFPAAIALASLTRKPWVAHIHSTQFDRSGERVDHGIYDMERRGMHEADRVITVSSFTKAVCVERYNVTPAKIEVVYNGADAAPRREGQTLRPRKGLRVGVGETSGGGERIVLFLGRITSQKGPEHFVAAARRVLAKLDNVKFVMAGAGDLARAVIEEAARSGIGHRFSFTGFLRGSDIDRVFDMADVYVMPSVSEPFGIAPLEAINHRVPVIVSRQSGVSEVLRHALKVDFWNTDDLADKIIAVLRHPPLGDALRENALEEVQDLTWDAAAERCRAVYEHALAAHATVVH